jgi:hypothetical protein
MNLSFSKKYTPANNTEFISEESDTLSKSKIIQEVQDEYKLYIDYYLQKDQSK